MNRSITTRVIDHVHVDVSQLPLSGLIKGNWPEQSRFLPGLTSWSLGLNDQITTVPGKLLLNLEMRGVQAVPKKSPNMHTWAPWRSGMKFEGKGYPCRRS